MTKTVKMKFNEDKYYNLEVLYTKGQIYDVPENMVDRWLKRGGEIIKEASVVVAQVQAEELKEEIDLLGDDSVEGVEQKEDDIQAPIKNSAKIFKKGRGRK